MASGPYFDLQRGTYRIQYHDGIRWRRPVVYRIPGWKSGSKPPRSTPPEVIAALNDLTAQERAARRNETPTKPDLTIAEFLASYRIAYAREQAASSVKVLDQAIRVFLAWCSTERLVKLATLSSRLCQKFLDERASQTSRKTGQPITPKRLNLERGLLMGAWSRAVRLRELPNNPWTATAAPGWERARKRKQHRPSWTPEEFAQILEAAAPWLKDLLVLGTQTGLRITALVNLEWRDIEWTTTGPGYGLVRVRPEADKVGRGYTVPMSRTCHDLLSRRFAAREAHQRRVLTARRGGPIRVSVADRAIRAACQRAGLGTITSPNHRLRRSFGRWAVLGHLTGRPVPLYICSRWLGHASITTTMDYLDLTQEESQQWMANVADLGPGPPPSVP